MEECQPFSAFVPYGVRAETPVASTPDVVTQVYAASLGDVPWAVPLALLAGLVDADVTALLAWRTPDTRAVVIESHGAARAALDDVLAGSGSETGHHVTSTPLAGESGLRLRLCAVRAATRSGFTPQHAQCLADLAPHLALAVRVIARVRHATRVTETLRLAREDGSRAFALVDAEARVLHASASFERLCCRRDGLLLDDGVVRASNLPLQPTLHASISLACAGLGDGTVTVVRSSGAEPYTVVVSAVTIHQPSVFDQAGWAWLTVTDWFHDDRPDVLGLQRRFGLTRAEARVAARLASGLPLRDVAGQLHVSYHTARTHLKRVMSKLEVSRQADMIRIVLTRGAA